MSQPLNDLLGGRLPLPGVAAWTARLPGRELTCQSHFDWLAAPRLEQAHAQLTQAAEHLARHSIRPVRLCWVFERLRLYFAMRDDGASLACFVQNAAGASLAEVEKLFEDFVSANTP